MGRPVVLSNGQLFVGLDEFGLVHDFYYPYVGLDNLTNARNSQHKIGIWVDGQFSWVSDGSWQITVDFEDKALISSVIMHSSSLGIRLEFEDFVDIEYNAFVRRVRVKNELDYDRDVRLFMHQVFEISRSGRADTALYVPDDHYLLDYKGRCCLLIAGKFTDGGDYDQYAVGNYEIEGKAGTFKDAEDGELSNNPVEHGGVDSVLRFSRHLSAGKSYSVDYWVVAADSQTDAQVVHTYLKHYDISNRLIDVRNYWQQWIKPAVDKLTDANDQHKKEIFKSLLIIKAHCDSRGSILASGDSSIFNYGRDYYCYCWPRDAAYAVWPLIRLGLYKEAKNFFGFARDTMHRDGYMNHKYQPDRSIGSTWHPLVHNRAKELAIQEDETASVVFMIGEYYRASHDEAFIASFYETYIAPCAHFMTNYVDRQTGLPHASYDLWEEKFLTTTYTVCTIIAALETAVSLAKVTNHPDDELLWQKAADNMRANLPKLYHPDGYFRKGFLLNSKDGLLNYDDTLDISSLYGIFMYSGVPIDDKMLFNTAQNVTKKLANITPIGGVVRYENDSYFRDKTQYLGNPWVVCSLWLAQYYIGIKDKESAKVFIDWSLSRKMPSGVMSEQFDPENGQPLSVAPLVWSHAETVNTLLDYYDI
jgi:GH15 family glucan-1,4-alpha-glucosidase